MKAAVVTLSDKGFRNEREDKSGELVQMMLKEAGGIQVTSG
jgi:molybdopterin adenylyltransferase